MLLGNRLFLTKAVLFLQCKAETSASRCWLITEQTHVSATAITEYVIITACVEMFVGTRELSCNVATRACAMWPFYLRIYSTTLSFTLTVGWFVNNELERMWKEPVLMWFGVNSDNYLDSVGGMVSIPRAEIWTPDVRGVLTTEPRNSIEAFYRVSHEEGSIFWEVTVSVILSKISICTCILFGTVSEIQLFHCTDEPTWHVVTRVAKCIDAVGGIFENVLY
jgi:hypothetical protein